MTTKTFIITMPLSVRVGKNSRPTEYGELVITCTGTEDKTQADPYCLDITSIKHNGAEILPVFEYLEHVSTAMDNIYNHCLDYIIKQFGETGKKITIHELKELAKIS